MLTYLARMALWGLVAPFAVEPPLPRPPAHLLREQPRTDRDGPIAVTLGPVPVEPSSVPGSPPPPVCFAEHYRPWLLVDSPASFRSGSCSEHHTSSERSTQEVQAGWLALLSKRPRDNQPAVFDGQASSKMDGPLGSTLKAQLQVEGPDRCAVRGAERWQAEEALQVPVAGPLFVFGQFNAGYNTATAQEKTLRSRTGVGCKLRPIAGSEIVLSGGKVVTHAEDPLRPDRLPREKSEMVVELQANYSLLGPIKLEYQGAATPAFDPLEKHRLNQDVRVAIPIGAAGHLRLGARHEWQDLPVARPWTDGMQLYLGVGLKR